MNDSWQLDGLLLQARFYIALSTKRAGEALTVMSNFLCVFTIFGKIFC